MPLARTTFLFITLFITTQNTQAAAINHQNKIPLNPISLLKKLTPTSKIVIAIVFGIICCAIYYKKKLFSWLIPKNRTPPTSRDSLTIPLNTQQQALDKVQQSFLQQQKSSSDLEILEKKETEALNENLTTILLWLDPKPEETILNKAISFSIEEMTFKGLICKKGPYTVEKDRKKHLYNVMCEKSDLFSSFGNQALTPTQWSIVDQEPRDISVGIVTLSSNGSTDVKLYKT